MPIRFAPLLLLISLMLGGCAKPPTLEEIEAERRALPALYLTETSLKQVEAPADAGLFVDKPSGEICYPAYECTHPECPGRSVAEQPQLFVHRDVLISVDPQGEFVWAPIPAGKSPQEYIESLGGHMAPTCPHCLKVRDLKNESDAQRDAYQQAVKPYELPATAKRRVELEAAYQEAFDAREAVRQGG